MDPDPNAASILAAWQHPQGAPSMTGDPYIDMLMQMAADELKPRDESSQLFINGKNMGTLGPVGPTTTPDRVAQGMQYANAAMAAKQAAAKAAEIAAEQQKWEAELQAQKANEAKWKWSEGPQGRYKVFEDSHKTNVRQVSKQLEDISKQLFGLKNPKALGLDDASAKIQIEQLQAQQRILQSKLIGLQQHATRMQLATNNDAYDAASQDYEKTLGINPEDYTVSGPTTDQAKQFMGIGQPANAPKNSPAPPGSPAASPRDQPDVASTYKTPNANPGFLSKIWSKVKFNGPSDWAAASSATPSSPDDEAECSECHQPTDKNRAICYGENEYICYSCASHIDDEKRPRLEEIR